MTTKPGKYSGCLITKHREPSIIIERITSLKIVVVVATPPVFLGANTTSVLKWCLFKKEELFFMKGKCTTLQHYSTTIAKRKPTL